MEDINEIDCEGKIIPLFEEEDLSEDEREGSEFKNFKDECGIQWHMQNF